MPPPNVLGPKYEWRQSPRNSQGFRIGSEEREREIEGKRERESEICSFLVTNRGCSISPGAGLGGMRHELTCRERRREGERVRLCLSVCVDAHRKDGNPLGWLALGRGARGRGFGRSNGVHFGWKKSTATQQSRWFYWTKQNGGKINLTDNKFYLHGSNSVLWRFTSLLPSRSYITYNIEYGIWSME